MAVMKHAITEMDTFFFNAIRLTLSAIVLGICTWIEHRYSSSQTSVKQRNDLSAPSKTKQWILIAVFAVLSGAIYQIIFVFGMDKTTAGNTALIMSSIPMWTAILSFLLLREKLGYAWLGISISFIGTLVVTLQKGGLSFDSQFLIGNGLVLVSALAWSLGAVISKPMLKFVSPIRLAFFATFGTLPLHYLMSVIWNQPDNHAINSELWICILYSGIFSTGFAYAMWNLGVKQLGASHAAVYQNLVPLVALIVAWRFLGESVTMIQIIGGSLIILGLFITRKLRPNRAA